MTTYNTGNPIGSTDPKDLYDNAQHLDALVNSTTELSHADRLAVQRKTWHGMEVEFDAAQAERTDEFDAAQAERAGEFAQFLADSAYQDLGVYGAGIDVTRYNQVFLKDGEFYRAAASLGLPYTTTGVWASESGSFVGVGDAALRQDLGAPGGSELVGSNDGASGARFSNVQSAINDLLGGVTEIAVNVAAFPYLAKCDGTADDTAAVNAAVLYLTQRGGGRLIWPTGKTCKLLGKVWVVSNIDYDLNGATLIGGDGTTGVMFETAYLNAGALVTNVGTAYQSHVIKNAKIHGGQVKDVGKLCNFQNFNMGCKLYDLELFNARQFGVFDACFYAHFDTVMHSGGTIDTIPSFHFKSANNAIKLNKVVTTVAWPYHFEGGSTAVAMIGCTQEGGTKGIKITGDCIGFTIAGNYAEAVNDWLDLSSAGDCIFDIAGNYFNYVDRVLFDGAGTSGALIGRWAESNRIVNIGQQIDGTGPVYRGRMEVTGRQNFIEYELNNNNDYTTTIPANWITSGNTNISFCSTFQATGLTDYRKKALIGNGLIPLRFSGDTGTVYEGTVPFCTVTIGATTTIDTQIKWQPNSLFAKFSFRAQDGNGFHELYGDIYGALFKRHDTDPMVMTVSDNGGFLRISLAQTAPTFLAVTGTVQICS